MGVVVLRNPVVAAPAAAAPLKLETVARGRGIQWKGAVKYNKRRPKKTRPSDKNRTPTVRPELPTPPPAIKILSEPSS
eukprot:CAMPEP_0168620736 /NCGR_PEP_ID=MMETSP0449_2-20121227/7310_1 /TAXON_ID=1082188 /ORGANISM="Strombidium rassoulzadegani, Strain ras09" /LENGTH=77 /DNA_ID=CAMNT_0008661789 /DNA_START=29 /DNA_END=262 /DNA_ORIENTATION=+